MDNLDSPSVENRREARLTHVFQTFAIEIESFNRRIDCINSAVRARLFDKLNAIIDDPEALDVF